MSKLANDTTPRFGTWGFRAGVSAFAGLGAVWACIVFWQVPYPDWGAALAWRYLGLKNETMLLAALASVCALLAASAGAALLSWPRRELPHRLLRHLAVVASFGCGALFLVYALKRRFSFETQPVECLIPAGVIACALLASLANRRGRVAVVHWCLVVAATLATAGALRTLRGLGAEYHSSKDTAAFGSRICGEGGRLLVYALPENTRAALAFFLDELPETTDLTGITPEDAIFADTGWIVDPAQWRVTAFFNGTCVLQRKLPVADGAAAGLTRSAFYGQDHRIAD